MGDLHCPAIWKTRILLLCDSGRRFTLVKLLKWVFGKLWNQGWFAYVDRAVIKCVLKIRWRLHITDADRHLISNTNHITRWGIKFPPAESRINTRGSGWKCESVVSEYVSQIVPMSSSCEIAMRQMPQNILDDKSTIVQVLAFCCQTTNRRLSQYWASSMSP